MNKLVLSLSIFLCVAAVRAQDDGSEEIEVRRIVAPPPSFNCKDASRYFQGYNTRCCKLATINLFIPGAMSYCNKYGDEQANNFIREYMYNTFQDSDFYNTVNFEGTEFQMTAARAVCVAECLFKNNRNSAGALLSLIDSANVVNAVNLKTHVADIKNVPAVWKIQMEKIIDYCYTSGTSNRLPASALVTNPDLPSKTCSTTALNMIQCIRYNLIGACDPKQEPTEPVELVKECGDGALAQDSCGQLFRLSTETGLGRYSTVAWT